MFEIPRKKGGEIDPLVEPKDEKTVAGHLEHTGGRKGKSV